MSLNSILDQMEALTTNKAGEYDNHIDADDLLQDLVQELMARSNREEQKTVAAILKAYDNVSKWYA